MSSARIFVKPRPGRLVRHPHDAPPGKRRQPLDDGGEYVANTPYWQTRHRTGDTVPGQPTEAQIAREGRRVASLSAAKRFDFKTNTDRDAFGRIFEAGEYANAAAGNAGNEQNAARLAGDAVLGDGAPHADERAEVAEQAALLASYENAARMTADGEKRAIDAFDSASDDGKDKLTAIVKQIRRMDSTAKGRVTRTKKALGKALAALEAATAAVEPEPEPEITPPPPAPVDGDEETSSEGLERGV